MLELIEFLETERNAAQTMMVKETLSKEEVSYWIGRSNMAKETLRRVITLHNTMKDAEVESADDGDA